MQVQFEKELKFLWTANIRNGFVEPLGGGSYVFRNPSTGFKQILKQNEYEELMEASGKTVSKEVSFDEKKEDEKPSKKLRTEYLQSISVKALKDLAGEMYNDVPRGSKRGELIQLIIDAEYEED